MDILVDENIPTITVQALQQLGHEVKDIRGTPDEGMPDELLWQMALSEKRILITTDKGFSQYRNDSHHGLLIVRLKRPNQDRIHRRVTQAIQHNEESQWKGLMMVIRDTAQSVWKSNKT